MRMILALLLLPAPLFADPPAVASVQATEQGNRWRFDVTLTHPDTGWDHYADGWRVETEAGEILGTRELLHPHVTEQPFTRSLSGVAIPEGVAQVFVRAKCSVDGWADQTTAVPLP